MKHKAAMVNKVLPGSIAEEAGMEKGDRVLSINGQKIIDIFDYRFAAADEELLVEIEKEDGEIWEIQIEKEAYEDLGIDFAESMIDEARSCTNQCIFCFIDQLPENLRETLYFKDDDSRLSFLTGNYVTLTNMSENDIDKIINYRMSPINISVHTTHPELRIFMLNNKFAGNVLPRIKKLTEAGITVNCQIVLCRDINDRHELDRTLRDLTELYPGISSISVVPVGITRYRAGLTQLEPYDDASSLQVITQVTEWQKRMLEEKGSRIVYLADEFYIMARVGLPDYLEYEEFPQIENGVGLLSQLQFEFDTAIEQNKYTLKQIRKVSIATGVSSYSFIRDLANRMEATYLGIKINVFAIKNEFFGENVTVTGLLTGQDLASQLAENDLGEALFISKSMLRAGESVFLDDFTVGQLAEKLHTKVVPVENHGEDFMIKLLGMEEDRD